MKWSKEVLENINFENITNREEKEKIAIQIAQKVKNGETIGFGSGSTSYLAVKEIFKRIKKENIDILAIPTSHEIKMLCSELEIPTTTIMENKPDWCFDGADEVNDTNWLIKGRGAAMFREKLNIANSPVTYILADKTKFVRNLGEEAYIPIECYPEAINSVKEELLDLGATEIKLRTAVKKDGPLITENNNFILDTKFEEIYETLEKDIKENKNIQKVNERKTNCIIGTTVELPVQETKTVQESMQVSQGKLVISLDVDSKIENLSYVASVYNAILGGGANSRLFQNVREKESLAYTAGSSYLKPKNMIFIRCGIEIQNYNKALETIKVQLDDLKNGKIEEEDIENAKKLIISSVKSITSEQDTEITYYYGQELAGTLIEISDYENKVNAVTKEQIQEIANSVSINTIYFLKD